MITFEQTDGDMCRDWCFNEPNQIFPTRRLTIYNCGDRAGQCEIITIKHQLSSIFIEPKYRCLGMGSLLLAYASVEFHITNLCLYAAEGIDRERLIKFYERHGFSMTENDVMVR